MTIRSLVVTHTLPWPARGGGAIRIGQTLEALATLGPVDVMCILQPEGVEASRDGATDGASRFIVVPRPAHEAAGWQRLSWLAKSRLPALRNADYSDVRAQFSAWTDDYDLVWMGCGTEGFVALHSVLPATTPIVANLDDLEDRKISSHRSAAASIDMAVGRRRPAAMVRRALSGAVAEVDIRRWHSLHRLLGASVDRIVVCSEVDRGALVALGIDNCVVIENCYPGPESAPGPSQVGVQPTLTMIGTLHYPPNADAARVMALRILPEVRRVLPATQLRLVGKLGPQVADLVDEPGVVATDVVDDLGPELRRADVAVVPIRFGSGTRIKILEAFAHRIPVVSTTIGAEGLDVEHGRELLLADDPDEFASACVQALVNPALRARLAAAGHARWALHHRAEDFRGRVVGLATELATRRDDRRLDHNERQPPRPATTGGTP